MGSGYSKQKSESAAKDELVLTPGGWRPRSTVFEVKPGQHVEVQDGRIRVIQTVTGEVIADLGAMPETEAENPKPPKSKVGSRGRSKKPAKRKE